MMNDDDWEVNEDEFPQWGESYAAGAMDEIWQEIRRIVVTAVISITVFLVVVFLISSLRESLINTDDQITLENRIEQIQTSLNEVDRIAEEVQELGQQAIEAEQRAADAIAISQLTEEQVMALDRRLNRDQTFRDVALLVLGAILGVIFERLAKLIGWIINRRLHSRTDTDK